MSIIVRMLKQQAVYWEPTGERDDFGNPIYHPPVEIKCRWEDVHEMFMDANGNEQVSNAKVYVDQDLVLDGYLRLGKLDAIIDGKPIDEDEPLNNPDVYRIRKFEKFPNLRVTQFLRTAML